MTRLTLDEFQEKALISGVKNGATDVWVIVDGIECTIPSNCVSPYEEEHPYEYSEILENDLWHSAWHDLYDDYVEQCKVMEEA